MKRRAQTATERDLEGLAEKRRREAAPEHVEEDITGAYSHDPELLQQKRRERRTTGERLEHLEIKYDRLVRNVIASRTKIIVAMTHVLAGLVGYLLGGGA